MLRLARKIAVVGLHRGDGGNHPLAPPLRDAFPDRELIFPASIDEALAAPWSEIAMVVLDDPADDARDRALDAEDAERLARWAVVDWKEIARGRETEEIRYALREALDRHQWEKRARRSEGDARSIATRICHDLRSPLSCLEATFFAVREFVGQPVDDASIVEPGTESVRELARVTDRMGLLCWASSGESKAEPLELASILDIAQVKAQGGGARPFGSLELPQDWPEDVYGVSPWVESIWVILLENALKFAGEKPHVKVNWEERPHEQVRFSVSDDGAKAPEEGRDDLFMPFHLLHSRRDVRGLGLPILLRLATMMGGACGYTKRGERGACFWFELPRRRR